MPSRPIYDVSNGKTSLFLRRVAFHCVNVPQLSATCPRMEPGLLPGVAPVGAAACTEAPPHVLPVTALASSDPYPEVGSLGQRAVPFSVCGANSTLLSTWPRPSAPSPPQAVLEAPFAPPPRQHPVVDLLMTQGKQLTLDPQSHSRPASLRFPSPQPWVHAATGHGPDSGGNARDSESQRD